MSEQKLTYEELEKKVSELEGVAKEYREENKNLRWYKSEYDKVEKMDYKLNKLKETVKTLVDSI